MSFCPDCVHYRRGYCRYHKKFVDDNNWCTSIDRPKEIPLPPNGEYRLAAVAAKKHLTLFHNKRRGSTDPLLRELRAALRLPSGYHLMRSRGTLGSPLHGVVYVREASSGRIVRILHPDEIREMIGRHSHQDW